MIAVGYLFGRRFINPILALKRGTHDVAAGQLDTRVDIRTGDEFARPRRRVQHDGRSPGRAAGRRQAAGAPGDVRPRRRRPGPRPVAPDSEHRQQHAPAAARRPRRRIARACSARTIERELETLKRFMDDLRNVVKPKPIERFAMDVNGSVAEIVESMRAEGERNGVAVEAQLRAGPLIIDGDRFALGRVYRNLITNAIQATAAGRPRRRSRRRAPATRSRSASPTPARASRRIGCRRSSTTSSRPSAAASASAWRSPSASSSSSTARSPSRAKSGRGTAFTLRFPARDDRSAQAAAS